MGRVALLANPKSGSGDAEVVESELRALGAEVQTHSIEDPAGALDHRPDRIVVAGGDGSIGPAAEVAQRGDVPLGVVPVGTANDFARVHELPDDVGEACRIAATGQRTREIELGRMGERPFVNVASLGLPPAAARRAHDLKPRLGALSYAVGALRAGLNARPVRCRVAEAGGAEVFSGRVWQATIACSGAFGAGSQLDADPTDGMLDAVVMEAGSRLRLALRAYGLRAGRIEDQSGVHNRRGPAFEVEVDPDTSFNVDGELCVRSGRIAFTVEPEAVRLVVG